MKARKLKIPKPLKAPKSSAYNPPPEKFVVVVHPWVRLPSRDEGIQRFCNTIGAWFECMLMSKHGYNTRVLTIYHLYNLREFIIVELPEHVNIELILGTHRLEEFSTVPIIKKHDGTFIYEYDYRRFGDPNRILRFESAFPTYTSRDLEKLSVKRDDYPNPDVPPPPGIFQNCYAMPLSKDITTRISVARRISRPAIDSIPSDEQQASTSNTVQNAQDTDPRSNAFTPYVPPSHLYPQPGGEIINTRDSTMSSSKVDKKRDPFEEEEDAKNNLRIRNEYVAGVKQEPGIKREYGVKVEPGVKRELGVKDDPDLGEENAEPISQEMQDLYTEFRRGQQNRIDRSSPLSDSARIHHSSRLNEPPTEPRVGPSDSRMQRVKPEDPEAEEPTPEMQALYEEWKRQQNAEQSTEEPLTSNSALVSASAAPSAMRRQRERNSDLVFGSTPDSVSVKSEYQPDARLRDSSKRLDVSPSREQDKSRYGSIKTELDREHRYGSASSSSNGRRVRYERDDDRYSDSGDFSTNRSSSRYDNERYPRPSAYARDSRERGNQVTEGMKRPADDRYGLEREDRNKRYKKEY